MIRSTVGALLDCRADATGIYVISDGKRCLYVGRTQRLGIGRRLYRHLHDGDKQTRCCKLSGPMRRAWPLSRDWTVEVWEPLEIARHYGFERPSKTYGPDWAERTLQDVLRPAYCAVSATTVPVFEQPSLWGMPT